MSGNTRAASALALASVASASATSASACSTCCSIASVSNIASTCPALTRSPSSTNTRSMATPLTFALTLAISLALMVPSALSVRPISSWLGLTVSTDKTDCSILAVLSASLPPATPLEATGSSRNSSALPPQYLPSTNPITSTAINAGMSHGGSFADLLVEVASA